MDFLETVAAEREVLLSAEFSQEATIEIFRDGELLTTAHLRGIFHSTYLEVDADGNRINSKNSCLTISETEWLRDVGFALQGGEPDFQSLVSVAGRLFRIHYVGQGGTLYLIKTERPSTT